MNPNIASLVRHGLSALGGFLVAKGHLSADQVNELAGAIITVMGIVWSIRKNKQLAAAAPAKQTQ
jgi:threonine/homoserine efflux transporter RhtA